MMTGVHLSQSFRPQNAIADHLRYLGLSGAKSVSMVSGEKMNHNKSLNIRQAQTAAPAS